MKKVLAILVVIGMMFSGASAMTAYAAAPIDWDEAPHETLPLPVM